MTESIAITLILLILALIVCAILAYRSERSIGKSVFLFVLCIIPPVFGNLVIICSPNDILSFIGYYFYFLGMDLMVYSMLSFSFEYTGIKRYASLICRIVLGLIVLDFIQYIINIFTHHAFGMKNIEVDGYVYAQLVPYFGQTLHRILDYGVIAIVILIFIYKSVKVPRIYAEKYYIILISLLAVTLWETYYIFSRTPIDRSMIGLGILGALVFFFSLYYRPFRLLDRMLANVASELPEALYFFDASGNCIWVNEPGKALIEISDSGLDKVISRLDDYFGEITWDADEWSSRQNIGEGEDKKYYHIEKHTTSNENGKKLGSFLSIRDITLEQQALEREKYIATHDTMTDLYTREHLNAEVARLLRDNPDKDYYVIYSNVNDFKIVNDIFGNLFGDHVLKYIANKIKDTVDEYGLAGRLVGDTFGMFVPVDKFDEATFEKELTHFTVTDGEIEHFVLMHLGVYKVSDRNLDVSFMFDRARIALSTIKDDYHTYIAYYDSKMRETVLWEQKITTQLGVAIKERQIIPYLQPIVNKEGSVVGGEALVRWNHPEEGFLAPYRFIPAFEKNGMIAEIDKYMWRSACELLAKWQKDGKNLFISINISPKDFYFMDVGAEIRNVVREYGVNPKNLRIEITESVMMNDQESRFEILNDFRREGFIVEMDDFGSGYSSLNMLKDMPVDLIKIDMAFLRKSDHSEKAEIILHNIVKMSYELGLISLTEGVETEEQYKLLAGMGCSLFQGYFFAKPMPVDEFEQKYV
ncbi:MAG: EAL domain-containing protein [Eubacterium sp.]|nr:EAL domain-containing protein [Eubacterium sp.]